MIQNSVVSDKRILLVDDDPHVRKLLSLHLRELGADVIEASNGEEAMARIAEAPFDAALVDLILPYFGGFRLCRALKEMNSSAWVAVITADDSSETRDTARESGADAFVAKPLDPKELRSMVADALSRSLVN